MKKLINMRQMALVLTAAATAALFAGCASPAKYSGPRKCQFFGNTYEIAPGNVYENAIGIGQIKDGVFPSKEYVKTMKIVLETTLKMTGFFAPNAKKSPYVVHVNILEKNMQPDMNGTFDSGAFDLTVEYIVVDRATNTEIYNKKLNGEYRPDSKANVSPYANQIALGAATGQFMSEIIEQSLTSTKVETP